MLGTAVVSIFIFMIVLIVYLEYRNEKKYQEKRREKQTRPTRTTPSQAAKKAPPKAKPAPKVETKPEPKPEPKVEVTPEVEAEPAPKEEETKIKDLPDANYPPFTHVRLLEMGLSDDEAKEFVTELIPQIEEQIPLIEEALNIPDFHQIEKLTHSIKGSATNIGTGGVSDLLSEYNTYVKTGTDVDVIKTYTEHLKRYTQELKNQYS